MLTQANAVTLAGEMKKAGLAASSLADSAFGHLLETSDIKMIEVAMKVLEKPAAPASTAVLAPLGSFGRRAEAVEVLARSAAGLSEGGDVAAAEAVLGVGVAVFDDLAKACRQANPQSDRLEVFAQVTGIAMTAVAAGEDLAESMKVMAEGIMSSARRPVRATSPSFGASAEAGGSAPATEPEVSEPVTTPVTDPVALAQLAEKFGKPSNKKAGGVRRHRQQ